MGYKVYHRKYPDTNWDYRGISTRTDNKEVIYYTLLHKGKLRRGVEIYSGRNYDVNSSKPSYSRTYNLNNFPNKYGLIVKNLIKAHNITKWSNKRYVNYN